MTSLAELKQKYRLDLAKYEPNPNCKFCKGSGEKPIKRQPGEITFCICLFIEPEFSDEIGGLLGQFATKQLEKMDAAEALQRNRDHPEQ